MTADSVFQGKDVLFISKTTETNYKLPKDKFTFVVSPWANITTQQIPTISTNLAEVIIFMGRELPTFGK